ncbi:MAG: class I SAM-dependent methyltransferase [Phycisphaerales bacterium]|jgi:SAM-dependent methyltransferase
MPENEKAAVVNELTDNADLCAYCGAGGGLPLYRTCSISGDRYCVKRCLECRAVFLTPRPSRQQLGQTYDDSYYGKGKGKFAGYIEKVLDFFRLARARRVSKFVGPPAKILDIGCGNGRFLGYLIRHGFEGYGTELPGKAASRAAEIPGLTLKVGHLSEAQFSEHFFDCVCLWHVFEHLTDPKETLQIIQRILKPGGYLMMSLPNIDSLQSKLFRGNWLHLDPPKHLFFLEARDLISELRVFGFKLISHSYFSLEQNPFGIQQSILNCLLGRREVLFEALKGNVAYTRQYSWFSITLQKLFCLSTFPIFVLLAGLEAALRKGGTMELIFRRKNT